MRKETNKIAEAFKNGTPLREARTTTDGQRVLLHGHLIAERIEGGRYMLTLAGWGTSTTRERLNGISTALRLGFSFYQRNKEQYVSNGVEDFPISAHDRIVIDPEAETYRIER